MGSGFVYTEVLSKAVMKALGARSGAERAEPIPVLYPPSERQEATADVAGDDPVEDAVPGDVSDAAKQANQKLEEKFRSPRPKPVEEFANPAPREKNIFPFPGGNDYAHAMREEERFIQRLAAVTGAPIEKARAAFHDLKASGEQTRPPTPEEVAAAAATLAAHYSLDPPETHLALRYAAASKEATQCALTATPDEAKRLNNIARLWSLTLDLCQRLKVAVQLPSILKNKEQSNFAGRLSSTFVELRKLEKIIFGKPRTPKDALITQAEARTKAYQRNQKPETPPPTPHSGGGEPPHLAA